MRRLGKTQPRTRPAFDGVIFPFSSFLMSSSALLLIRNFRRVTTAMTITTTSRNDVFYCCRALVQETVKVLLVCVI